MRRDATWRRIAERHVARGDAASSDFANTSSVDTFNLFRDETIGDENDPPGFRAQSAQLAPRLGASRLAMTAYDLPPGQAICPYHFHWGDEEWLVVVAGTPTIRTPDGEQTLEPGDVVCFPVGPDGAHRVHNATEDVVRVALFSNKHEFGIIEYPDSDKIGVWGRHNESLDHMIRRSPNLDYWDGERP
jgi:uncharacterized cupin superfamily protein